MFISETPLSGKESKGMNPVMQHDNQTSNDYVKPDKSSLMKATHS